MKKILRFVILFFIIIFLMAVSLALVSLIPRSAIQQKSEESANYILENNENYYNLIKVNTSDTRTYLQFGDYSKVDQYADTISLSMAYYLNSDHPLESVLWARYYDGRKDTEAPVTMMEGYAKSVKGNTPANMQYMRYWHGNLVFIRLLLTVMNLKQMKLFHEGLIMAGIIALVYIIKKRGYMKEGICFVVSMIAVSVWFVPISLEYTWMFLLMLLVSIIAVKLSSDGNSYERIEQRLQILLFLSGMFAAYLDFLTTETITLLIPLLLAIRILFQREDLQEDVSNKNIIKLVVVCVFLWGIGYVLTWTSKWALSALVFQENVIPYIQDNIMLRVGTFDSSPILQQYFGCLKRNIFPLFPFGYGMYGGVFFLLFAIVIVFLIYRSNMVLRKEINWVRILLYFLLGSIVYIRFFVMLSHSYGHYFFTYRAQAASVLALCFMILEIVEFRRVERKK